jgi:hypothetical protein
MKLLDGIIDFLSEQFGPECDHCFHVTRRTKRTVIHHGKFQDEVIMSDWFQCCKCDYGMWL